MCLYEPVNGKFPSDTYCNMHPGCERCPYSYDEEDEEVTPNDMQ